jgi:hypothetical protein
MLTIFVTGFVRTEGPTITFKRRKGSEHRRAETYIDFLGTKAGARLNYGGDFTRLHDRMWRTCKSQT